MKQFYKSKTFWFNTLALLMAVAASFGYADFQPDPETGNYALVVVTVINVILRFVTSEKITLK